MKKKKFKKKYKYFEWYVNEIIKEVIPEFPEHAWKLLDTIKVRVFRLASLMKVEKHRKLFVAFSKDYRGFCKKVIDDWNNWVIKKRVTFRDQFVDGSFSIIEMYEDMLGFSNETREIQVEEQIE